MKIKISFIALLLLVIITSIYISSCKDDIDNLLDENPYEVKLEWNGYYNFAKDRIFSGSFNSVKFLYDEKRGDSTFAVVIENSTVGQLSLEMLSLRLRTKEIGEYVINDSNGQHMLHFQDFSKPAAFTQMRDGKVNVTESMDQELLIGTFDAWGVSGSDTMFIKGSFTRRKKP